MRNFRLLIAYDGTRYQGWQRQGNTGNTIQAKLEGALSRLLDMPVKVNGSGRTDAGAHARGQVANFYADTKLTSREIQCGLQRYLPEDIGILKVDEADLRFHARLSAKRKTYCYRVWNTESPNVFERRYVYQMPQELDLNSMRCAAGDFLGTHDFFAFCSNKHLKKSSIRTVESVEIAQLGQEVRFTVTGNGFLYNMVRIMVGTLLEVGQHRREPDCIPAILASRVRENAGETAPAKGLCLMEVEYG